ncbi:MAG TPA: 16S rRNA (guanine(527)-N(7))-methyltransferase RsmG [Anaerolineaceae bacterium]
MEKLRQEAFTYCGVTLNPRQLAAFEKYERELLDWNTRINLTAIRTSEEVRTKHFLDSLTCALAWGAQPPLRLIDVGTGAGFPALPLKIIYPAMQVTLVESIGKKIKFCEHISRILELKKVQFLTNRAEVVGQDPAHREQYDWAVGRAVAGMPVLMEYLLPLVKVGGAVLAMKGESGPAEAVSSERAMGLLGGKMRKLIPVNLPGVVEPRYLVVIDKIAPTPRNYPRRVGEPNKKPL